MKMKHLFENWRKYLEEELSGKQAIVYHGSRLAPDKLLPILMGGQYAAGRGSGKTQYGKGIYTILDPDASSKVFKGSHYGHHIYKLKVNLDGFIIFDPDIAKEVYGDSSLSIADQLRRLGKEEVIEEIFKDVEGRDVSDHDALMQVRSREAMDSPLEIDLVDGSPRGWHLKAQEYSTVLEKHVNGMAFTAGSDGRIVVIYRPELVAPIAHAEHPGSGELSDERADRMIDRGEVGDSPQGRAYAEKFRGLNWQEVKA